MREGVTDSAGVLREARQACQRLVLFGGVLADPIGRALVALLDQATARGATVARIGL
jgi:hypothetical protein